MFGSGYNGAIHGAARKGNLEAVKYLLGQEIDVNVFDDNQRTALHCAAYNGHEEVVRYLLEEGAAVNLQSNRGYTALQMAARARHLGIVSALLEKGAAVNLQNENGSSALHEAVLGGSLKDVEPELHETVLEESAKVVYALLAADGVDVNLKNKKNKTALHYAARAGCERIITALLEKGAAKDCVDNDGRIPLHFAAQEGKTKAVKLLIEASSDVDIQDAKLCTALHFAAQEGKAEAVKLLIAAGANVNILRDNNCSALHLAVHRKQVEVVKILVAAGADINKEESMGYTPLAMANKKGDKDFIDSITFLKEALNAEAIIQRREELPHPDEKVCMSYLYRKFQEKLSSLEGKERERERSSQELIVKICKVYNSSANSNEGKTIQSFGEVSEYVQRYLAFMQTGSVKKKNPTKNENSVIRLYTDLKIRVLSFIDPKLVYVTRDVVDADCDEHGQTRLHRLVRSCDVKSIKELLEVNSSSLNIQDFSGNTPLHLAVLRRDRAIVKILASREDCDVELLNDDKKTARQIIVESGNRELLAAFKEGRSEAVKDGASTKRGREDDGESPLKRRRRFYGMEGGMPKVDVAAAVAMPQQAGAGRGAGAGHAAANARRDAGFRDNNQDAYHIGRG